MATLVLLRHGRTVWGEANRFTGWGETPLDEVGFKEARAAAELLRKVGPAFDLCFSSRLLRAAQTLEVVAEILGVPQEAIRADWRLNERHYGALQGESREAMAERYGEAQIAEWRRSFHGRPPEMAEDDPRFIEQLARFPEIDRALQPRTESMAEGAARTRPVWTDEIAPALRAGRNVLVVAHTSPIRGIVREIEGLTDAQCGSFRVATAVPKRYVFDENLAVLENRYLLSGVSDRIRLLKKQA
jgi:2,3-bisphosphoglycerate-dependent phosphoglycerate mutase